MLLSFFTIDLKELPCATTRTCFPDLIVGTIVYSQNGITLSIVVFKLYVKGNYYDLSPLYLLSNFGCLSSFSASGGGGIS